MRQIIQNHRTGELFLDDVPRPSLNNRGLLVRNTTSLLSAGTEKAMIDFSRKSLLGKAKDRPDLVRQAMEKVHRDGIVSALRTARNRLEVWSPLGYSSAGTVVEVGSDASGFQPGDRVACAGAGYANHAEFISVPRQLCVHIPGEVGFDSAAFVTVGAVALQGIRVSEVVLGESVGVIGLGIVGQLTVQILCSAGCRVFGMDVVADRASLAEDHGAHLVCAGSEDEVIQAVEVFTKGRGLDAVIIAASSSSNMPVELAGEIARHRGRIVAVGTVRMDIPRRVYYQKELDFRVSRSYGPGRYDPQYEEKGVDYPYAYVRWTEQRNMEAFVDLVASGKVNAESLITHRFPINEALRAYQMVLQGTEPFLGVVIDYETCPQGHYLTGDVLIHVNRAKRASREAVGVGMIGAGTFANSFLLPAMRKIDGLGLRGVATATGLSAKQAAKRFGFEYCTSDYRQILDDKAVDAVLVATRHNLHASIAIEAMAAQKAVFVEKPLAVSEDELREILQSHRTNNGTLTVGFNRRFAPLVRRLKRFLEKGSGPLAISYRVNAGAVSRDSWIEDAEEGGGRIVGEICHFVDVMIYLAESLPREVYAQPVSGDLGDTLLVTLQFADGSIGSIGYFSEGDPSFPKEYIEVFGRRKAAVLQDFRKLTLSQDGKRRTHRGRQDKGHRQELAAFFNAVKGELAAPIPLRQLVATTLTTFKIGESIQLGRPVPLPDIL